MKKVLNFLFLTTLIISGLTQCGKSDDGNGNSNVDTPTVSTNEVINVTQTSAICGGNITSAGYDDVIAKGVCWSTSLNPTINDNCTNDGPGPDSFTSSITGLEAGTTYYVRAYATNNKGTGYGESRVFTTAENGGETTTLTVSPLSLNFESNASSGTITIQSNSLWAVVCSESWCSATPNTGNGDGTLMVSAIENENIEERTATITISSGETVQEVAVSQKGRIITLSISPESLDFEPEASSKSISVQCNGSWTVSCPASWCSVNPSSGSGNASLSVMVSANESSTYRTAVISVSAGAETRNISVSQHGVSWVIIDGHRAIDLGLPSGTKWADCNVNASSPSEYGGFYSFTATGSDWGGHWHRPTLSQIDELTNLCEWTWSTENGHNGFIVEGPNGNSIFLPAAGFSTGANSGTRGYYWSSEKYNSFRYALYFRQGNVFTNLCDPGDKYSVRLVAN